MREENKELWGYKETFSKVHASEQLKERVINMAENRKKSNQMAVKFGACAAVAALALGICFHSQIQTFAERIMARGTTQLGEKVISAEIGGITVHNLTKDQQQAAYKTIEDVESVLGVDLLSSDAAYDMPVRAISINRWSDESGWAILSVDAAAYYVNDMEMAIDEDPSGNLLKATGDNPYQISYEAELYNTVQKNIENVVSDYKGAVWTEEYETADGLQAEVFRFGGNYNAIICHDGILYRFAISGGTTDGTLEELKAFLDTLK